MTQAIPTKIIDKYRSINIHNTYWYKPLIKKWAKKVNEFGYVCSRIDVEAVGPYISFADLDVFLPELIERHTGKCIAVVFPDMDILRNIKHYLRTVKKKFLKVDFLYHHSEDEHLLKLKKLLNELIKEEIFQIKKQFIIEMRDAETIFLTKIIKKHDYNNPNSDGFIDDIVKEINGPDDRPPWAGRVTFCAKAYPHTEYWKYLYGDK